MVLNPVQILILSKILMVFFDEILCSKIETKKVIIMQNFRNKQELLSNGNFV